MQIVPPSPDFFAEYESFCRETWNRVHDRYILHDPASFPAVLPTLLRTFDDHAAGRHLPPGFVPSVTRWIVSGPRLLGVLDLRPRLSPFLARYGGSAGIAVRPSERNRHVASRALPLALDLLRSLGASPLMLSCTDDNRPSLRTLLASPFTRVETDVVPIPGRPAPTPIHRFYYPL